MTIWLIILPFGALTFAMRGAFLFRAQPALRSPGWQRWLRYVMPAVLAALVLPALVVVAHPLAPDTLRQLLAAGLAALVAWRFQNVLATVASGMGALWGLAWLPATSITLTLPLGLLLLASAGLLLLLAGNAWAWVRLRRSAAGPLLGAPPPAVTVTPVADRRLSTAAVSHAAQKPAGAHLHCPWCWCPLPMWALYCGQCGLPQQTPVLAITQPLAAVTVRPEGSERSSIAHGAPEERTNTLLLARGGDEG